MHARTGRPGAGESRNRRRRAGAVIAATLTCAALAACGGSSGSGSKSSSASNASTSGGTLTMQFSPPVSLNPALEGTSQSDIDFGALDYDSLIYQLGDGTYVGDLATKWDYAPNSENEVFNLTLRSGVHFSDGSLMTPQSVISSLNYFKGAHGPQSSYLATMTSAKVSGANGVQLKFSAPEPELPFLFSQYQDVGQIIGPKGVASPNSLTTTSDGAGPYVLSPTQTVANSSYVYTENPHYWNPSAVKYKTVIVKVIPDPQTAVSSAQSGQVQVLTSLPGQVYNAAKGDGLQVFAQPFAMASLILMGRSEPGSPLAKLPVRQAINMAVNRAALSKGLGGYGSVPTDGVGASRSGGL